MRPWLGGLLALLLFMLGGCGTPRSVPLLMRTASEAMEAERRAIDADILRQQQHFAQQRATLAAGYEKDLLQRQSLDAAWVLRATALYLTAREELLRTQHETQREYETRQANLLRAMAALQQAQRIIAQQDALLGRAGESIEYAAGFWNHR